MHTNRQAYRSLMWLICLLGLYLPHTQAQLFFSKDGRIAFESSTPIENIEAVNQKATCILDTQSGKLEWALLVKAFQFDKALMQVHFNENYMDSKTYPKSIFKGRIVNLDDIDFNKEGSIPVTVEGDLSIHGVTQKIRTEGNLILGDSKIIAEASFDIEPEDYEIKIPAVVRNNIAKVVTISVKATLVPFHK